MFLFMAPYQNYYVEQNTTNTSQNQQIAVEPVTLMLFLRKFMNLLPNPKSVRSSILGGQMLSIYTAIKEK